MVKYLLFLFILAFTISFAQEGDNYDIFTNDELAEGITMQIGWSGSVEISDEDYYSGQYCIKWTVGTDWDGPQFTFSDLIHFQTWSLDTIEFMVLCEPGFGDVGVWLLDDDMDGPTEKEDYDFIAYYGLIEDSTITWEADWQQVKIPFNGINRFNGRWDDDLGEQVEGEMDTTRCHQMYITITSQLASGNEVTGTIVYIDDIKIKAGSAVTDVEELAPGQIPYAFTLEQNYPNPFNPSTTISYALQKTARVTLDVYDITGRHVATLVNGMKSAGSYSVTFDAQDLPSGIYYYQLKAENFSTTRKMVLVR